jgi:hypothetical protein
LDEEDNQQRLKWQLNTDFCISDCKGFEFSLGNAEKRDASDRNQVTPQVLVFSQCCH